MFKEIKQDRKNRYRELDGRMVTICLMNSKRPEKEKLRRTKEIMTENFPELKRN